MPRLKDAHIHRYRDSVALSLPGMDATHYLSPQQARQLADALRDCAHSCETVPFAQSSFGTVTVALKEPT